jgi:O-antigen/teichoic acid export membrane protein
MRSKVGVLVSFAFGQAGVQVLQLIIGLLLIRWLSIEEYAAYTLVFSFQLIALMLTDLGVSSSIIALIGKNKEDTNIVSKHIKAAYDLRIHFFLISALVIVIVFPFFVRQQDWSLLELVLFTCSILMVVYFNGNRSIYRTPLVIHQKIKKVYLAENTGALVKLVGLFIAKAMHFLTVEFAVLIHACSIMVSSSFIKKLARKYVIPVKEKQPEIIADIKKHIYPTLPGLIFSTFQGQIAIFLITIFGATQNIAEVGALGRLGQVFSFFNVAATLLVAPYFARQETEAVLKKYVFAISAAICLMSLLIVFAYNYPNLLIWVLGYKYKHLEDQIIWVIINAALLFLTNFMWVIQNSRRWIYNWMPFVSIPGTILLQVILIVTMDLSLTHEVLMFNIFCSMFAVAFRFLCFYMGGIKKR